MSSKEIATIVAAQEIPLVHRFLELHEERLEEQLMDQRRVLGRIELLLTEAIRQRRGSPETRMSLAGRRDGFPRAHDRAS